MKRAILLAAAILAFAGAAQAQQFPNRPVTLVVPWPAGGGTDIGMRALAAATEKHLGQKIVIENKPGASGTIGPANMAASAAPDGYTVAQIPITVFRLPAIQKTNYDPAKDFTYIIQVTGYTFGVVVRADAPWKTFNELLDYAKANPGKINYGAPGAGTSLHITMEQIAKLKGIKWTMVPFKGQADSLTALLGGHIDVEFELDRLGRHRQRRQGAAAGDVGRGANEELAGRSDLEGPWHQHGLELAVRHRRAEGHGPGGGEDPARRLQEGHGRSSRTRMRW